MAENGIYSDINLNVNAKVSGAEETSKKMDEIGKSFGRTASEIKTYNTEMLGTKSTFMMDKTIDVANNMHDVLDSTKNVMSEMTGYGDILGSTIGSIVAQMSRDDFTSFGSNVFSDVANAYAKAQEDLAKTSAKVEQGIIAHQTMLDKNFADLAEQEDTVRQHMSGIRKELSNLDTQAQGLSFEEFKRISDEMTKTASDIKGVQDRIKDTNVALSDAMKANASQATIDKYKAELDTLNTVYSQLMVTHARLQDQLVGDDQKSYWTEAAIAKAKDLEAQLIQDDKVLGRISAEQKRLLAQGKADSQKLYARNTATMTASLAAVEQAAMVFNAMREATTSTGEAMFGDAYDAFLGKGEQSLESMSKRDLKALESQYQKAVTMYEKDLADSAASKAMEIARQVMALEQEENRLSASMAKLEDELQKFHSNVNNTLSLEEYKDLDAQLKNIGKSLIQTEKERERVAANKQALIDDPSKYDKNNYASADEEIQKHTEWLAELDKQYADQIAKQAELNAQFSKYAGLNESLVQSIEVRTNKWREEKDSIDGVRQALEDLKNYKAGDDVMITNIKDQLASAKGNLEKVRDAIANVNAKEASDKAAQREEAARVKAAQREEAARVKATQRAEAASLRAAQREEAARVKAAQREEAARVKAAQRAEAERLKALERERAAMAKMFTSVFKSGFSSFSKTASKEFKSIHSIISKIGGGFKNWHKEQKSIGSQAKALYGTFTSLWSMLKTRAKRKLVGLMFEDMMATVGEIAKISPRFNTAFSGFIVSAKTLGSQIIAAFEPIASIVLPVLSTLLDYMTSLTQSMAQFVSRATGNDTFIKATKGQYDYAKSLDKSTASTNKAKKSAKEYENTVMSFDQLHKLNGKDDATDTSGLIGVDLNKAKDGTDAVNELGERFWDALSKHDYEGAGRTLGEGVNRAFDWLKNIGGWEANGTRLTSLLHNIIIGVNGFVDELSPERIGGAIGDVSNTFIHLFEQWTDPSEGFDFRNFGLKIGGIFGNFLKTVDWDVLGEGIIQGIQGSMNIVNGFMSSEFLNEETGEVESIFAVLGHSVHNLFSGAITAFNPSDWAELASGLINGFFEFLATAFGDPTKAAEFGEKLASFINQTVAQIDSGKVTEGINAFTTSFNTAIGTMLEQIDWSALWSKLKEIIHGLNWQELIGTIGVLFFPALVSGLFSSVGKLAGAFISGLPKILNTAWHGLGKITEVMNTGLTTVTSGIGKAITKAGELVGLGENGAAALTTVLSKLGIVAAGVASFEGGGALGVKIADKLGLYDDLEEGWADKYFGKGLGDMVDNSWRAFTAGPLQLMSTLGSDWATNKLQSYYDDVQEQNGNTKTVDALAETQKTISDGDSQLLTAVDGLREATTLPTTSVSVQDADAFTTNFVEGMKPMMTEMADRIVAGTANNGEVVVNIDGQTVARAVNTVNAKTNKRQNPLTSFARSSLGF